ncbi:MAG: Kelch repeat-containing protein, partial [Thermoplasmata archaeon]
FGGWNSTDQLLNDLWEFVHGQWRQLRPQGAVPPARASAAMAFNASSGEVVLFGGEGYLGPLGDTWVLQFLGALSDWVWTQESPRQAPAPREDASFAYDAVAGKLVLFGGCGLHTCPLGDTWTYGGGLWTECSSLSCRTEAPRPRRQAAFSDDPTVGGLLLFGGCGSSCPFSDTWTFNATGAGVWTELPLALHPPASYASTLSYNSNAGYPVLWGGIGSSGALLGGMGWAFVAGGWVEIPSTGTLPPTTSFLPEFGASLVYNPVAQYVLLFGGCSGTATTGTCSEGSTGASTWEFTGGAWHQICGPRCGPPPRWDPIMFFDAPSHGIVMWGGCQDIGSCTTPLNDTWVFAGENWTQLNVSSGPSARADAAVASWYPESNNTVIFGGWNGSAVLGDAWNFSDGGWSRDNSSVSGVPHPPPSFGARMVYAPTLQRLLLYGGYTPGGGAQDRLWELPPFPVQPSGGPGVKNPLLLWNQLPSGPAPVFDAATSFDIGQNELLVYGGTGSDGLPTGAIQIFHPATDSWSPLTREGPAGVGPRTGSAMAYDPNAGPDGGDLLVGGLGAQPSAPYPGIPGSLPEGSLGWGQGDSWWYSAAGWVDASSFV